MKRFKPERYIPDDSAQQTFPAAGIVAYMYPIRRGRHGLMVYKGRQTRAALHVSCGSEEELARALHAYAESQARREAAKATARTARAAAAHGLAVGDVVAESSGYDQTNVYFFQVVRVVSPRTVEVRAIASTQADRPSPCAMSGYVVPAKDAFLQNAEPFTCRTSAPGVVIRKGRRLHRWYGSPLLYTSYH